MGGAVQPAQQPAVIPNNSGGMAPGGIGRAIAAVQPAFQGGTPGGLKAGAGPVNHIAPMPTMTNELVQPAPQPTAQSTAPSATVYQPQYQPQFQQFQMPMYMSPFGMYGGFDPYSGGIMNLLGGMSGMSGYGMYGGGFGGYNPYRFY